MVTTHWADRQRAAVDTNAYAVFICKCGHGQTHSRQTGAQITGRWIWNLSGIRVSEDQSTHTRPTAATPCVCVSVCRAHSDHTCGINASCTGRWLSWLKVRVSAGGSLGARLLLLPRGLPVESVWGQQRPWLAPFFKNTSVIKIKDF